MSLVGYWLTPDLQVTFNNGDKYYIDTLLSMKHRLSNNFEFKNHFIFTANLLPLEFIQTLEDSTQIKKITIIETLRTAEGKDIKKTTNIKYPIFSINRKINSDGTTSSLYTIEITT